MGGASCAPRLRRLDEEAEIVQRVYYATGILVQNGFEARVVSGGMLSHEIFSEV